MATQASAAGAAGDLEFIRDVVDRTDRRVDPHAFHYVHWGAIVLIWYPLANWFQMQGMHAWMIGLGIGALVLGILLSAVREILLARNPRLVGENTSLAQQMMLVTFACIGAGVVLSTLAPPFHFIEGKHIPTLWGRVYANMAVMIGIIYRREFLYAGLFIFAGAIAGLILPSHNGFILGPAMGLGLMVPGLAAVRRVKRMRTDAGER